MPKERREWTFEQHLEEKRKKESGPREQRQPSEPSTVPSNRNPGGRSTRNPKRAMAVTESKTEETAEASTPGVKKSVSVGTSDEEKAGCGPAADGPALISGVEGYYTCDGGCDRATCTNARIRPINY